MTAVARKELFLYAQLAFPLAFAGLPLYIFAPDYYAREFGISLAFLSGALFVIRLFDAFIDPLIGRLSDIFHVRLPVVMGVAGVIFSLSLAALFNPPPALEHMWFVTAVFFATMSFSVLMINLNATGSALAGDASGRTRVSSWREIAGLAGLVTAVSIPAVVSDWALIGFGAAVVAAVSCGIFVMWLLRAAVTFESRISPPSVPWRHILSGAAGRLYAVYGVSMLASSLPAVLIIFFVRDFLQLGDMLGVFLIAYFVTGLAAIPAWRWWALRRGQEAAWRDAMSLSGLGILGAGLLGPGDAFGYGLVCVVTGFAFGAELLLPPAILSRVVQGRGAQESAGSYYGIYALIMKASLALATAMGLYALGLFGFAPAVSNAPGAVLALVLLYAVIPAVIKWGAAWMLVKGVPYENDVSGAMRHGGIYGA